jgi:lipid II isoglutaminyl synthase (glutamine-hydrolysing)
MKIKLAHIYPKEMNIYGDNGNRLILQKRLEWRGYEVETVFIGIGDEVPGDVDIILGGGGQDAGQLAIEKDIKTKADALRKLANDGVVMLMVCGMYQMFCRRFVTHDGRYIEGIGVFEGETIAGPKRLIGNVTLNSTLGLLVGYENHSGKTYLDGTMGPLGRVKKGAGNNGEDKSEGCVYKNVFGTYLHGPLLSKNPILADELLRRALERRGENNNLTPINDDLELLAQKIAITRPR